MPESLLIPLFILILVGLNTVAQILLKLGSGMNPLNFYLLGGITAYGLSTIFYVLVLGKMNVSSAYPLVIGLTIAATTFSGAMFLREAVPFQQWLGIGLILSGVSAIALAKAA